MFRQFTIRDLFAYITLVAIALFVMTQTPVGYYAYRYMSMFMRNMFQFVPYMS